jgi:replicative DNA helicase
VPPHNLQAEESLLGAMLLSRDAIAAAVEVVSATDFYKPAHGHIYDAVTALFAAGEPVDPITVAEELRRAGLLDAIGGPASLVSIQASTPATTSAGRYARIVEEHALLRRLIGVANEIAEIGYELPDDVAKAVDRAESMVFDVAQRRITDTMSPIGTLLSANLDRLEQLYERGEAITGVPTGYTDLDHLLSGLQPSNLVVVGARPAMGKCVKHDTRLVDPSTGAMVTIAELHERGRRGERVEVFALDHDLTVTRVEPSMFVDDGVKPVYRVHTRLGREVATTLSHPFLTPSGWHPLAALAVGNRIAVPREIRAFGTDRLPDAEVELLAASTARFGLVRDERVPAAVFTLPREQLALFLNRFFGVVGDHHGPVTCSTAFLGLAQDVQHLLLRFGLNARIRARVVADAGTPRRAFEVELTEARELQRFAAEIGARARAHQATRVLVLAGAGGRMASSDGVDHHRAASDIYWDEIVAITYEGEHQVYDLTVPGRHNFVAADVFVHNTSLALGMATHAALEGHRPVLVFSLEMSQLELSQRILCAEARVDSMKVRNGKLADSDWAKISHAVGRLAEAPIWIDDNPAVTMMEIRAKARRLKSRVGDLGMVVIDYIQLMTGRTNAESRQVEVAEISRGLKILARELDTPVVALAQLNRGLEQRADKRPMLSDLRESGSLEQDADVVMFIYRDEVYNPETSDRGTAEIIVAKHRSGPTGSTRLAWLDHYTKFANMARGV